MLRRTKVTVEHSSLTRLCAKIRRYTAFPPDSLMEKATCDIWVFGRIRTVYPSALCPWELAKSWITAYSYTGHSMISWIENMSWYTYACPHIKISKARAHHHNPCFSHPDMCTSLIKNPMKRTSQPVCVHVKQPQQPSLPVLCPLNCLAKF